MDIRDEHIEEILKLYGMQALRLGPHFRYDEGKKQMVINVRQFWIAELSSDAFSCCISVAHTDSHKYGLIIPTSLIIPSWQMNILRLGTTKGVKLQEWNDLVIDALAKVNIVPTDSSFTFDGDDLFVSLVVLMNGIRTNMNIDPNPQNPDIHKLFMALIETAKHISRKAFLPFISSQLNKLPLPIVFGTGSS